MICASLGCVLAACGGQSSLLKATIFQDVPLLAQLAYHNMHVDPLGTDYRRLRGLAQFGATFRRIPAIYMVMTGSSLHVHDSYRIRYHLVVEVVRFS